MQPDIPNYSNDKCKRSVLEQVCPLAGTMPDATISRVLGFKRSIPP